MRLKHCSISVCLIVQAYKWPPVMSNQPLYQTLGVVDGWVEGGVGSDPSSVKVLTRERTAMAVWRNMQLSFRSLNQSSNKLSGHSTGSSSQWSPSFMTSTNFFHFLLLSPHTI